MAIVTSLPVWTTVSANESIREPTGFWPLNLSSWSLVKTLRARPATSFAARTNSWIRTSGIPPVLSYVPMSVLTFTPK